MAQIWVLGSICQKNPVNRLKHLLCLYRSNGREIQNLFCLPVPWKRLSLPAILCVRLPSIPYWEIFKTEGSNEINVSSLIPCTAVVYQPNLFSNHFIRIPGSNRRDVPEQPIGKSFGDGNKPFLIRVGNQDIGNFGNAGRIGTVLVQGSLSIQQFIDVGIAACSRFRVIWGR